MTETAQAPSRFPATARLVRHPSLAHPAIAFRAARIEDAPAIARLFQTTYGYSSHPCLSKETVFRSTSRTASGGSVLVQREMESGRAPLESIARARAGTRKQPSETATGFKRRSGWVTRGGPDAEIAARRPSAGLGLTAAAHTRSERPTCQEKKNLESRVRCVLQRDDAPGMGAVQTPCGRVARGGAPVQLPVCAFSGQVALCASELGAAGAAP
jgi:hypothetical protein